jgi:hypothetical protein
MPAPVRFPLDPMNRRDLLRAGSVAAAASLLPAGSAQASMPHRADAVIYLWMGGGVTHIDSFDPKPEAPEEIRGTLEAIDTALPGVQFAEPMPEMARIAQDLCLIRTFSHDSNDHLMSQAYTLSGRKVNRTELFKHPNIGSVVDHLRGGRNGLPGYIAVPGITRPGPPPHDLFVGGWLGRHHAPFCVGGQPDQPDFTVGEKLENPPAKHEEQLNPKELALLEGLSSRRIERRMGLKQELERLTRLADSAAAGSTDEQFRSAANLLTSERVRGAFDLSRESDETRARYGRTKIGSRCLMARRLVESGARFVMVDYGYDPDYGNLWDNHNAPSQNFPHTSELCKRGYHLAGMDRAFAALISDLKERGRLDSTLVVFLTEFGRTPKINARGGRDHWGACGSLFFAGGGVQAGQVIGQTDGHAAYPLTPGYTPADLAATIYTAIGIDPDDRIHDLENRPHPILDHGHPIPGVLA